MKSKVIKFLVVLFIFNFAILVNADIKCGEGKPGETVDCTIIKSSEYTGTLGRISVDSGLKFDGCDVCSGEEYTILPNKTANFKFKIDSNIKESKSLSVTFAGETALIKVNVEEKEETDETTYIVTLIPGNGQANVTKTCKVNSLNSTCNVTLEDLNDANFTGWGKEKNCTEGSKGNIKVNKDITYYACFKKENTTTTAETNNNQNSNLLLKSLVVKNGDEEINLGFSIRIKEYTITVPTSVESLNVDAVAQEENVIVTVNGNEKLEKTENKITITLTDENKATNEYIINVKKSDEISLPLLTNLNVGGYDIKFKPETFVYKLAIDSRIKSLNFSYEAEKEEYDVKIVGNENLKNGSEIKVVVTDLENDTTSTYIIRIEQQSTNLIMYIIIGAVVLVILIILLIIVVKKGKKNKNQNANKQNKQKKEVVNPVSSKNSIPEIKPSIPVAPENNNLEEKKDIEVLDF